MYAYHKISAQLRGEYLLPLNELRDEYPDLYLEQAKKYEGRESLCKARIPPLDCEWPDVIMFTFCPPEIVIAEYTAEGRAWRYPGPWFRLNPDVLDPSRLAVFLNRRSYNGETVFPAEDFLPYSSDLPFSLAEFQEATRRYYQTTERPLIYKFMPHLLHRGRIPIAELERIEAPTL